MCHQCLTRAKTDVRSSHANGSGAEAACLGDFVGRRLRFLASQEQCHAPVLPRLLATLCAEEEGTTGALEDRPLRRGLCGPLQGQHWPGP